MELNLAKTVVGYLKAHPDEKFTARQIAEWVFATYPEQTVVFPDAQTKIFLTASAEVRAERRYKQLIEKGIHANVADILQDLQTRDARDSQRSVAPLQKSESAKLLDTSELGIGQAVEAILNYSRADTEN